VKCYNDNFEVDQQHTMPRQQPEEAKIPAEAGEAVSSIPRLLPFTPSKAARWFLITENHFATAKVNSDVVKYTAVLELHRHRTGSGR
jgi:hypothetical protein